MVDAATLEKLEAGFKKLKESDSKSLLKKYLTQEVFDKLKTLKTPTFGSTLLDVIQSGLENHDSGVGIYAPDAEAYTVFADLFDPIIEDYHGGFKKTDKHPAKDFGDVDTFGNLDPAGEYIISTRVRCGRSMEGYPFNPCLTEAQYKEMEEKVSSTLSGLEGELKGTYYPLTGMTKEVQQKLIDDHFLFKEGDRFLQAANACRFWPTGRGIYHNDNKTFLVWCNEEDHLRLISMQMGGDLGQVYRRLVSAVNDIEKRVPFSHNDRLGFLTFCPTNLGTTIRASVHIKVPKLAANANNTSISKTNAGISKAPFSVIVLCTKSKYFCSGVIVDLSWVLTSAHCLHDLEGKLTETNQSVVVVAGTIGLSEAKASIKSEQAQIRKSEKIVIHEDYTWRQRFVNDLALIEMSEPFLTSEWVKLPDLNKTHSDSPLVPGPHDHSNEEINILCSSFSYGKGVGSKGGYRIKKTEYLVNKHCHCLEWIRSYKSPVDILRQRNIFICDKNVVNKEIVCEGDNGGPLMCDGALRGLLTNVFHYNNRVDCKLLADHEKMGCSGEESYVVFTDLCYFTKFLTTTVKSYPKLDDLCNVISEDDD